MKKVSCYLVGGAVRDQLLGLEPKDRDYVVVGATPDLMLARGFKQVGASFPVFLHPETGEEYALARREKKVAPGYQGFEFDVGPDVSLIEDLMRRDLTINAIAYDTETGEYHDPFNGRRDLENGIIRHTSEAFAEDPLRVLRVARFASRYSFKIAAETSNLCAKLVDSGELDSLSADRIWTELQKLLSEKRSFIGLKFLSDIGALLYVKRLTGLVVDSPTRFRKYNNEDLTLSEKNYLFLNVFSMSKDYLEAFRVPSEVTRECKFFDKMIELTKVMSRNKIDVPNYEPIVRAFDAFREEIKNHELQKVINFCEKVFEGETLFEIKNQLHALESAFSELLKLDFTESVKTVEKNKIKEFVFETKVSTIKKTLEMVHTLTCPFCGNKPSYIGYNGQPAVSVFIKCDCGACGPAVNTFGTGFGAAMTECVIRWNKRKI